MLKVNIVASNIKMEIQPSKRERDCNKASFLKLHFIFVLDFLFFCLYFIHLNETYLIPENLETAYLWHLIKENTRGVEQQCLMGEDSAHHIERQV